jgi:aminopeptidase N
MGSARYWAAIRGYIDGHRFGRGSTRALLDALDAATPVDLRPTFAPRFPGLY